MLFLVGFAGAEPSVDTAVSEEKECSARVPSDSLPGPGATAVPLDVQPVVLFTGSPSCADGAWTLVLSKGDEEIASADAPSNADLAELPLSASLEPDTAYVLTASDDGSRHTIGFTTSDRPGTGEVGAPEVTDVAPRWLQAIDEQEVEASATTGLTESLVEFVDEDGGGAYAIARDGEPVTASWSRPEDESTGEACVHVLARDLSGVISQSPTVCDDVVIVESGCGCGHAGGVGFAWIAALAMIRRRR